MPLDVFLDGEGTGNLILKWDKRKDHLMYRESIFAPIAPEWATGEVLVGAAYRKLLLGIPEGIVNREQIKDLPPQLQPSDMWDKMFKLATGLSSPSSPRDALRLPQLMPFVPSLAEYACVLGNPRGRWDPGNLLLSTISSGRGGRGLGATKDLISKLQVVLAVQDNDDVFARFVEASLQKLPSNAKQPRVEELESKAPAWRSTITGKFTPSERFSLDLDDLLDLKPRLTRRQWTVLFEALLRMGLTCHMLWLCQFNLQVWNMVLNAVEDSTSKSAADVENVCWNVHINRSPSLELGKNALPLMKVRVQENAEARIGINLVLHALDDIAASWQSRVGVPAKDEQKTPADKIASFLSHIASHSTEIKALFQAKFKTSLRSFATKLADANPELLVASSGYTRNLFEFLRYNLLQLQTKDDELGPYDQAYLLLKKNKANNAPWIVQPGPATLIMMVHACCQSFEGIPASMDDFKTYLREYGIYAPTGELQRGQIIRDLEQLGLIVDSPDAGGGRLLVNPF